MEILTAYQTANRCYQRGRKANHVGILVHSTGAVNRNLKRYVDAPERLGKNQYGNHWNQDKADKCMHAFIGYDKDQAVIVAHTLPYAYACWGCGKGTKGSYNYDPTAHLQFEICQGSNTDAGYYWRAIGVAAEYCAHLCALHGFAADQICSHKEAAKRGYASNHGDPESWMRHFGDDMAAFRARVATLLRGETLPEIHETKEDSTMQTLRRGSAGSDVRTLQEALAALGYNPQGGVDGSYGPGTEAAVRAFQTARGLTVDGTCGPVTWAAIDAARTAAKGGEKGPDGEGADEPTQQGQAAFLARFEALDARIAAIEARL